MAKINFSDAYYANIIQATATYRNIYVTDDGNIYRTKTQAESRMKDALKLRRIVRWCEIEKGKEPISNDELDKMFDKQFALSSREMNATIPQEVTPKAPAVSLEDARIELEKRRKERETSRKSSSKKEE